MLLLTVLRRLQVARSIDNATMIQRTLLALLCIEGIAFMIAAVVVLVRLLSSISVHRQALFSVFLAVPQGYLRTLASKSVSIGDDDAEEDGESVQCLSQLCSHRSALGLPHTSCTTC